MNEPSDAHLDPELQSFLASRSLWHEPDPGLEDAVVAAVAAAPGSDHAAGTSTPHRHQRRRLTVVAAAAAVALVVTGGVATGVALLRGDAGEPGVAVALATTTSGATAADGAALGDRAPVAMVDTTPAGVRIVLDTDELPPAPAGAHYHLWLVNDGDRVSAGTFLGGGGRVELWCGVDDPGYRTVAVTLEHVDDPDNSGTVVLEGSIDAP